MGDQSSEAWQVEEEPGARLTDTELVEKVRRYLRGSARLLFVCWLMVTVADVIVLTNLIDHANDPKPENQGRLVFDMYREFLAAGVVVLFCCALGLVGAVLMLRVRSYRLAMTSATVFVLASLPLAVFLPILPFAGFYAIARLFQKRVRRGFAAAERLRAGTTPEAD